MTRVSVFTLGPVRKTDLACNEARLGRLGLKGQLHPEPFPRDRAQGEWAGPGKQP